MEQILNNIGAYGRYQKLVSLVIGFMSAFNAMTIYATIFIGAEPKLLCKAKQNLTIATSSVLFEKEILGNDTKPASACDIWSNFTKYTNKSLAPFECNFDTTYYGVTLVSEWELVCNKLFLVGLTQTAFMVGSLSGLFSGYFSDRFGRKRLCIVMCILLSLTLIIGELVQLGKTSLSITFKYTIYTISQYLIGFASYVLYVTSYVLLIEMTTSKYTTLVSNFNLYMYVVGELIILLVAYLTRSWHLINWIMAGFSVILVFLVLFTLPESPRFLLARKQYTKAFLVLKRIALLNGKVGTLCSENDFKSLIINEEAQAQSSSSSSSSTSSSGSATKASKNVDDDDKQILSSSNDTDSKASSTESSLRQVLNYLKLKSNTIKTIFLAYMWISLSLIYYGVSLGT